MSIKLLVRFSSLLFVLSILLLQGCATSAQKTAYMRNLVASSQYDLALVEAENALLKNPSGVMENMNVGLLRRLENDFTGSNKAFENAKQKINALYTSSVTEYTGAVLTNDESISFQGDRFEQVLVHLYMASNYLQLAELDSARVELLQSQTKMNEWGEPKDEIPFMRYFAGILFEMMGEEDSAAVSYRKAVDAYKNTYAKHGLNVPLQLKYDLLRVLANMRLWDEVERYKKQLGLQNYKIERQRNQSTLVVVLGNGMVSQREQRLFYTWSPELKYNIRVAVPDYIYPPAYVNNARVRIADQSYMMQTVSNIDGMARAALSENMHIITARAIARAVIKKKTELKVGENSGSLGQMTAMIANFSSEIADTRCWNTLPQQFELARINIPAGDYNVAIELINSAGYIVDVIYENVTIKPGAVKLINKRWTSPVVRSVPVVKNN